MSLFKFFSWGFNLIFSYNSSTYRLDQILGKQGSKAKDVYASKISLASRVVKIERQVDDIETKLDQLIELYMEDRKRILSLPLNAEIQQPQITGRLVIFLSQKKSGDPV